MAIRTSSEEVAAIIEVDEDISLDPFIAAASALVDQVEQHITDNEIAESSVGIPHYERLTMIETWLAAHFYAIRDPRTVQERAGSVMAIYQSKVALGLNVTHYGQQAIALDTTGVLLRISNGTNSARRPGVHWLGTEE